MRRIFYLFLVVLIFGCMETKNSSLDEPRPVPRYKGIDGRAYPIVLDYVNIAKKRNVKFTKPITIGFTDIHDGEGSHRTVGVCYFGKGFREIEIDNEEWYSKPAIVRRQLLRHELSHCLCGRDHDYTQDGVVEEYPTPMAEDIENIIQRMFHYRLFYAPLPGRFKDGCPLSIMYTHILPEACDIAHEKEYEKEMLDRCHPW